MNKKILVTAIALLLSLLSYKTKACHALPLVNYSAVVGPLGVTVNGSSGAATCGCGPYWMQVEIACTAAGLTGLPPAAVQFSIDNWAGPGNTYNAYPWFFGLLNVPNYVAPGWPDACVQEPYTTVFIPFTSLCPGQTYFIRAREWLGGSTAIPPAGPWSAMSSFVCPGVNMALNYSITAVPANYCAPNSATLAATNVNTSACGNVTYLWSPGGATTPSIVVSPAVTTVYQLTVTAPCQTPVIKSVTVNVGITPSPAFTPLNPISCTGSPINFNHTGTAGVTHTWSVASAVGVSIVSPNIANPVITFANPGNYVVTHIVSNGTCSNTLTTNVTINPGPNPAFTVPTPTQCLVGNSYSFVGATAGGTHSYTFNPAAGAPAAGAAANYGPGSFTTPGNYTVFHSVTLSGCTANTTSVISVSPHPSLTLVPTNAICGNNNGSILINNTTPAGQTVVSFSLNGAAIVTQNPTGLPTGAYTVAFTNNFGCITSSVTNIANTPGVTNLATTFVNPSCGFSNGSITLGVVTGGTGPFTYSVNNGPFVAAPPLTNLPAGNYTITVKDANNCVFTKVVVLVNTPAITAATFTTAPTACVGNTGVLGITGVTGGTAAYSFSVNGVATTSITNNLAVGPKTITIKDANGCTYTTTANIPMVTGPTAANIAVTAAACGNANGSATVTSVTGGLPAYQYSFNGGPFVGSAIQAGMLAGPKSVVIMDANSCTLTVNFVIGNTGSPSSAIATLTNVSCFNGANGGFSVSTSGGTPGYSYTLTPGNITNGFGQFTNLTAQNYTINVKDALGCITTVTTSISQPAALTLNLTSLQPSCNGGNNGTITATAGGGTSPYVYNINGGPNQASNTFTNNISANAYNITVIDNLGCSLSQTIAVTQPLPITLTLTSIPANCSAANGSASVAASGGTPIYSYTWSLTGGNNPQTTGVIAGNYTVTVKDTKNCVVTGVVSVTATPGGTAAITNVNNVTCNGAANGSLTANMIGNVTAPLSYTWSNGPILQTNGPLAPGNYTVTVTDFYGCKSTTVGTVTQPSSITVTPAGSPALCFGGATGSASVIASGGTPGYTYLWSPNGSTTSVTSGLLAGTYSIQVTDANGCVQTRTLNITQPSSVTINTSTLTAACNQANGVASATASGGSPAYTYTWSTGFVGQTLSNVTAGTYTVQVKDANGCLYVLAATVPNASGPAIGISSFTNPSCFGGNNGIATTTISGGTAGPGFPIYSWSNGQNTGTATNLLNGVYTVTLTDAAGCIASTSVTITQPTSLTINVSGVNPKCFNATNGTANAGVAGGTGPYTYTWLPTPGAGGNSATPSGMGPGNYNVTVTDSKGCIIQGSVALANPPQMLSSVSFTNPTCFNACNGLAVASTTNAIGAISYYWTGGPVPLTTQNVANLCANTYTMLATDQNSCTSTTVFNVGQPTLLTVSISAVGSVSCSGGSNGFATATPGGGTPGYTYNWSNAQTLATSNNLTAGNYTITVTDSKSCTATAVAVITQPAGLTATATGTNVTCFNLNNGIGNVSYSGGTGIPAILWQPSLGTTQLTNNLAPGTHTVTLQDGNGCSITRTIVITQPTQLVANITTVVPTNCGQANGSSSVAASGGAGGYTYQWSSNPTFTNPALTNVVAQAYTVTVTDANNCSVSAATVIPNIAAPTVVVTNTLAVTCFGLANGGATITTSGGAGGNTYLWSYLAQTTQNVNNLPSGLHSITVTDAAGCVGGAVVNITEPAQLVTAIGSVTNVACSGQNNGGAQMLAVGGTTNYVYLWQPSAQTNSVLTGVGNGVYSCTVTDANGCTSSKTVTISQPNPLIITTNTVVQNNCNGFATGQINTSITGGTPTYTIAWLPVQPTNPIITNLTAGSYSLSVLDALGCSTSSVYTLVDPSALVILGTSTTIATCGNSNGTASVTIGGGSAPYSYNWNTSTPQLTPGAIGLPAGTWSLTTTDNKGCVITASVNITAAPLPSVTAVSTNIMCFGQGNGSATLTASGVGGYSYNWSPSGLTTAIINGLGPAIHSATVTDANGCKTYTTVNISEPNVLALNVSPAQTICFGNIAQIFGQASGGTVPYNYSLTNLTTNATTNSITPNGMNATPTLTSTTQYTISVIDVNGCSNGPQTIIVNVRPALIATGASYTSCADGKVVLSPNITSIGNGGPYNYIWSNGSTSANNTVTANYAAANPNTYTVIIDDGCTIPNTSAVFNVLVNPAPNATFTPFYSKGCAPLTVTFTGLNDSTTTNPNPFFWTFSGGSEPASPVLNPQTISFPDAGTYSLGLVVTNKYGCKQYINDPLAVEVYPVPVAGFFTNPGSASLLEPTIHFTNTSTNASSYVWDFGDYGYLGTNSAYVMNPSHLYTNVGNYQIYLVAINSFGCKDTATSTIEITPDMGVYIPNAFTPDGNGRNDIFMPYGYGINEDNYKMEIFDRWGELIFTSSAFRKGWDGTVKGSSQIAQDGVYIYKILITDLENNKKNYVGHVTLIKQ
ncbi:gliding motility-associated C-terminal domain-containing protein [Sediminibacterium sp.]|uniref:T9SS type B sorting domain-containing protein n=1 Tax=Sediminibacterium sp. TaxID=1917865 RepID=UPI002732AAFF|nr:gliding motility-associated C-terminal domain-containing protein [Sediminibacterium sp.]MDP3567398.1 gliding motility-associated C-terminal domain-containing protein [Sediminibacterium sp.]